MKDDWQSVPGTKTHQMQTEFGTFTVQPTRGYPPSRTFVVKHGGEVLNRGVRDGIEARKIAEAELRRLRGASSQ